MCTVYDWNTPTASVVVTQLITCILYVSDDHMNKFTVAVVTVKCWEIVRVFFVSKNILDATLRNDNNVENYVVIVVSVSYAMHCIYVWYMNNFTVAVVTVKGWEIVRVNFVSKNILDATLRNDNNVENYVVIVVSSSCIIHCIYVCLIWFTTS